MNRIYRRVWNDLTRAWVAVAEIAQGRGKRSSTVGTLAVTLTLVGPPAWALGANTLPSGGKVVAGSPSIG